MPGPDTQLMTVFSEALERTDPAARAAYLDGACRGNAELRRHVEELLAAHAGAGRFLEPAATGAAGPAPAAALPKTDGAAAVGPDRSETDTDEYRAAGSATDAAPAPPAAEAAGTLIAGRYKLLQQIGEGGMGTVWMADQTEPVKRRVAVKLIRVERGQSRIVLSRFEAERQAIALMDHPHIARLLDAGTTPDGSPFFVMELVRGVPLDEYCDAHKLGIRERLELFMQVCSAVQHAHQKGIIHRDLKPSNILVESHDGKPVPRVIDFGLAKATSGLQLSEHTLFTAFGSVMGTPLYMAPEQANFNAVDVDTRADIYALGVILFELLTGTTPITRESMKKAALDEMLRLIREQDAPTPSSRLSTVESAPSVAANRQMEPRSLGRFVKGELDWIVMKALAKERDRRYETASGFARDVERFLNNEVVAAGPPSASYRLRKFVKRNRGQVIAASVILLALLAGIVGTTWGLVRAERARRDEAAQRKVAEAERHKAEQSEAQANLERARALGQRTRAESRETQAIDAVKRFRDSVANEPELKNSPRLEGLRKSLLKEPLTFFKDLRDRLQADNDTRPESLLRLALASLDLGDLTNEIGDQQDALKAYRESLAIHQKLAEANPTVTEYQRGLGNCYISIAAVLRSTGELVAALKAFESASEIFQRLADTNASVADFRSRLAFSHNRRGAALRVMGRHAESEAELRRALALYQKLIADNRADTQDVAYLAGSHGILASVKVDTGELAQAEPEFLRALAIQQKLADDHPAVTDFCRDLALTHMNLGVLHYRSGKPAEAEPEFRRALAIHQKLVDDNPAVTSFRDFLAWNRLNLGMLLTSTDKLAEAKAELSQALAIYQKLIDDNPTVTNFREGLGMSHMQLGMVLMNTGKPTEAEAEYRRALALLQMPIGDSSTLTQSRMMLGWNRQELGTLLMISGRLAEAEAEFRRALAILRGLPEDNNDRQVHLADTLGKIGDVLSRAGMPTEALEAQRKALAIRQKWADTQPANVLPQADLAKSHLAIGRLHAREKRFAEAFAALDTGLALCQKVADADPKRTETVRQLGSGHAIRGWARVRAGQPALAAPDLRRALELWAKTPQEDIEMRFERGHVLALLAGLGKDPKSGVTAAQAAAFAEQSVPALRDAVSSGWNLPDELKEPDFDAIRDRADFKKFVAELEKKTEPKK